MKIKIVTLGCKLNFAESSALMNSLIAKGHTRCKQGEEADVVIVNTCTVTDTADHKDRQAIHRVKREHPNARVIVTGCYARLKPQEIAEMIEVDHVMPKRDDRFEHAYSRDDRTRCFLKVQDGCNYFCTYCTIPMARGRSRNPRISELVSEAQLAIDEGAKEIILTGVNIGDFGRSTGESFIDLLKALDGLNVKSQEGNGYRIRISSCEPNLLSYEIIDFVATSSHFAPHFHIPLQSGNDEMLKIMHRRYTRDLFKERVEHIKRVMPNAFIGVDCMVGVRGETEERFADYIAFVESLPVSQLHVFTYSERANTKMLEMDLYIVPQKERERRSKLLHEISARKLQAFYQEHAGEEGTVLWESKNAHGEMYGFTENYIKVSGLYDRKKVNTFEQIRLK
ncbi:MAG: MiaB/RimO family radical SAM methylthiotransferase [Paludibacteraceae bacterium]|nr:MiaB/RimO family radical SAM methylthiotransferase [Paludibacteraceae bacterium]